MMRRVEFKQIDETNNIQVRHNTVYLKIRQRENTNKWGSWFTKTCQESSGYIVAARDEENSESKISGRGRPKTNMFNLFFLFVYLKFRKFMILEVVATLTLMS